MGFPAYRDLLHSGQLEKRVREAYACLSRCTLCPRSCSVDRTAGEHGFCGGGALAGVSSFGPHFGEESPLVGRHGSGTIFFAGCNLKCCFCQNYEISHLGHGRDTEPADIAGMMRGLEDAGCHNINFVTPTHYIPQMLSAIHIAAQEGLSVPIVYNCGGYEDVGALGLLKGVVDIYMPDFKFWSEEAAGKYCNAPDYREVAKLALAEMQAQVGDLIIKDGIALRGLLIRHLVMPGGLEDSRKIFEFIAHDVSPRAFVNVMAQYRPCYRAGEFDAISERLGGGEFRQALEAARHAGLERVYH
jgi:putative pyruvate formate lyase activating enzyme